MFKKKKEETCWIIHVKTNNYNLKWKLQIYLLQKLLQMFLLLFSFCRFSIPNSKSNDKKQNSINSAGTISAEVLWEWLKIKKKKRELQKPWLEITLPSSVLNKAWTLADTHSQIRSVNLSRTLPFWLSYCNTPLSIP